MFVSSTLQELAEEREAVRDTILGLRFAPVMFEAGARPHPARDLYRAYLAQSHVFVGIYGRSYGWVGPGMTVSGLEEEYQLSADKPRLIYIKAVEGKREPMLDALLDRIRNDDTCSYSYFQTAQELRERVANDLMLLLSELFVTAATEPTAADQPPPGNLPYPANRLIGRERELNAASTLLLRDDVHLVTLTGPGGTGKSRLALEIGRELRDRFPDGAYLVRLEAITDPGLVLPTIASSLGLGESVGGKSLADVIRSHLLNHQILLLLDNFEHLLTAASDVASLLQECPQTKVLVTSRTPLRLRAERVLPVPPLASPPADQQPTDAKILDYPAVRLFVERTQAIHPAFQATPNELSAVAEICRRLDGLPLAIELAAARSRLFSPRALLSRLEPRLKLLRGGRRDLPPRQQTMSDTIAWSYELLDEPERHLLRCSAVFSGGWALDAVEAVCEGSESENGGVLESLELLVESSLIQPSHESEGETRLRMLETIREFALERLGEDPEADLVYRRHAHHFMALAVSAEEGLRGPAQESWQRRLEPDLDNIRAAMAWALGRGEPAIALRIAADLWEFWDRRGYWQEAVDWLRAGLAAPAAVPDATRAISLTRLCWFMRALGDYAGAVPLYEETLALWSRIGDQAGLARTLSGFGAALLSNGDVARATSVLDESIRLFRSIGDAIALCSPLINRGILEMHHGDPEHAAEFLGEALSLAREGRSDLDIFACLDNLGELFANEGVYDRAEECLSEALSIAERLGDRCGIAEAAHNLAVVAWRDARPDRAFTLLADAIPISLELGDKEHGISSIERMAYVLRELREPESAARLLAAGEALRAATGLPRPPSHQADFDTCQTAVRKALGPDVFDKLWREGATMSFEQAAAHAVWSPSQRPADAVV